MIDDHLLSIGFTELCNIINGARTKLIFDKYNSSQIINEGLFCKMIYSHSLSISEVDNHTFAKIFLRALSYLVK